MERHNKKVHGPKEKGRRSYIPSQEQGRCSYIPSQEQAQEEDERRFGGKQENEERIRNNRKKNEQRLKELEIEKLQEALEKKKWEWASTIRSPSPRRWDNRWGPTEVFYPDGRREFSPAETFGGPRREQHQRPGTSTGSRPSGRVYSDYRVRRPPSDDEEEEQEERRDEESGRRPQEMGEWERAQEGEREKGKGKLKRREDAEEVVVRVTSEAEESKEEKEIEESERFKEECGLKPGTVSKISDQLSGTVLSDSSIMSQEDYVRLLGETMNDHDNALEKLDKITKKKKNDRRKKEKRKKKKEEKRAQSPDSDDDDNEMEEEDEK